MSRGAWAVVLVHVACGHAVGAVPRVFWASDPVRPDETVLLQGSGFADGAVVDVARLVDHPARRPGRRTTPRSWTRATVLQRSDCSIKFVVPA